MGTTARPCEQRQDRGRAGFALDAAQLARVRLQPLTRMNSSYDSSRCRCDGVSRGDFLHLGLLTTFGLSVTPLFRLQASAASPVPLRGAKATSCILIWLD